MRYSQKIECNVSECVHNCLEDSTCRLDRIQVSPCKLKGEISPEDRTACSMYIFGGDMNFESSIPSNRQS